MANPRITAKRSLADILRASGMLIFPTFLSAMEISLPARSPTKHQVVDMGIFEYILKTKSTMANKKSIRVASGTSYILDFLSTTY